MSVQPAPATAVSGVRVHGLGVRYGEQDVITGLDLDVQAGEFLVLLGPSGCGKSTLLHSIAGLLDTAAGRIEIGGQEMTFADPSARGIGMVDCQQNTGHLASLGGREIPRADFLAHLTRTVGAAAPADWSYDESAWGLLWPPAADRDAEATPSRDPA